jgi:hypothetical protein
VERARAAEERARAERARAEALREVARAAADAKSDAARAQVKVLEKALQTYFVKNNEYPTSLDVLTTVQPDGGKPYVETKALIDPWDKPYQYDLSGKRNNGKKPDVWAVAPDKTLIGNWPEKK